MRALALLALSFILALSACQRGRVTDPVDVPDPGSSALPARAGEGLLGGTVTLNGRTTTDPSYKPSPYGVSLTGKQDQIALITLSANSIPATTHPLITRFRGVGGEYGAADILSDGKPKYIPFYFNHTEPATMGLYNSYWGGLYDQAAKWNWAVTIRPAEDADEPNDDENPATVTDRRMGRIVGFDQPISGSFFRSANKADLEDWYQVSLTGTQGLFSFGFADTNDRWGLFDYTVRSYDESGLLRGVVLIGTGLNKQASIYFGSGASRRVYLQVTAVPQNPGPLDVTYGSYTINMRSCDGWSVSHVAGSDTPAFNNGSAIATLNGNPAIVYQGPTGDLTVSLATSPFPRLAEDWNTIDLGLKPGFWFMFHAIDSGGHLILTYPLPNGPTVCGVTIAKSLTPVSASDFVSYYNGYSEAEPAVGPTGPVLTAWQGSPSGGIAVGFAEATAPVPLTALDWNFQEIYPEFAGSTGLDSPVVTFLGSKPVIVAATARTSNPDLSDLSVLRALVAEPQSQLDWNVVTVRPNAPASWLSADAALGRLFVAESLPGGEMILLASHDSIPSSPQDYDTTIVAKLPDLTTSPDLHVLSGRLVITDASRVGQAIHLFEARSTQPRGPVDWTDEIVDFTGIDGLPYIHSSIVGGGIFIAYPRADAPYKATMRVAYRSLSCD